MPHLRVVALAKPCPFEDDGGHGGEEELLFLFVSLARFNSQEADGGLMRLYRRRSRREQLQAEEDGKAESLAVQEGLEVAQEQVLPQADTLVLFR